MKFSKVSQTLNMQTILTYRSDLSSGSVSCNMCLFNVYKLCVIMISSHPISLTQRDIDLYLKQSIKLHMFLYIFNMITWEAKGGMIFSDLLLIKAQKFHRYSQFNTLCWHKLQWVLYKIKDFQQLLCRTCWVPLFGWIYRHNRNFVLYYPEVPT